MCHYLQSTPQLSQWSGQRSLPLVTIVRIGARSGFRGYDSFGSGLAQTPCQELRQTRRVFDD